jgi:Amidohydrolase family
MFVLALIIAGFLSMLVSRANAESEPAADRISFHKLQQDVEVAELLRRLQAEAPHGAPIIFRNVRVVNPEAESVTSGQTVVVTGSRITWVGDSSKAPTVASGVVIEGNDRFLSPGLVDMHVHSSSAAGWLLDLDNGVTTVRDMDGFPWLLKLRDSVNARRMLAPVDIVGGTIINAFPLDGYAVVPRTSQDARRIVRQQAACGYDFIKIHNNVPLSMFDAIADQARKLGMDLVGHVPHDISLDHAIHSGGMRTTEHLKGFLIDQTLLPSDEDFSKALSGAETWITPTLYTRLGYDRGEEGRRILTGPMAKFVPQRKRSEWAALLDEAPTSEDRIQAEKTGALYRGTQEKVMKRLVPLHPHWLAGTDADGYSFNVMGCALVEELQLLRSAGLTPGEVLRAATIEPARAMRQPEEFGLIKPHMRADLVLLQANPLEIGAEAFRMNRGVMAHGYWLDRTKLNSALEGLSAIFNESDANVKMTPDAASSLLPHTRDLMDNGFVFDSNELVGVATAFRRSGVPEVARQFELLADVPTSGPCAEFLPTQ